MEERGFGRNPNLPPVSEPDEPTPSWEELNNARVNRYEENRGLFLVHTARPSKESGQVVDVEIRLCQHGPGPLAAHQIRVVEYTLGPKFTNHSLVSTDEADGFAILVSMWGPMLCLAKVYFADGSRPLLLERYVNFDENVADVRLAGDERQQAAYTLRRLSGDERDELRRLVRDGEVLLEDGLPSYEVAEQWMGSVASWFRGHGRARQASDFAQALPEELEEAHQVFERALVRLRLIVAESVPPGLSLEHTPEEAFERWMEIEAIPENSRSTLRERNAKYLREIKD